MPTTGCQPPPGASCWSPSRRGCGADGHWKIFTCCDVIGRLSGGVPVAGVIVVSHQIILLDVRQDERGPAAAHRGGRAGAAAAGEVAEGAVVVVEGEADLLEVVGALQARGRIADLLDGGQQQADQDGDDGDHHQQFDQREAGGGGFGDASSKTPFRVQIRVLFGRRRHRAGRSNAGRSLGLLPTTACSGVVLTRPKRSGR